MAYQKFENLISDIKWKEALFSFESQVFPLAWGQLTSHLQTSQMKEFHSTLLKSFFRCLKFEGNETNWEPVDQMCLLLEHWKIIGIFNLMRHCTTSSAGRNSGFLQLLTNKWCINERFPNYRRKKFHSF